MNRTQPTSMLNAELAFARFHGVPCPTPSGREQSFATKGQLQCGVPSYRPSFDELPSYHSPVLHSSPPDHLPTASPSTSPSSSPSSSSIVLPAFPSCATRSHGVDLIDSSPPLSPSDTSYNHLHHEGSETQSLWWQMSSSCQELLHTCRNAGHSEPGSQDLKKVQDHLKKMASLFKALSHSTTQKRKRRSKYTTYHHYSPSLCAWYREQPEARGEIGSAQRCHQCHTTESPEWRSGPLGSKTLCNACGLRYSKTLRQEKSTNPLSIKSLLN